MRLPNMTRTADKNRGTVFPVATTSKFNEKLYFTIEW